MSRVVGMFVGILLWCQMAHAGIRVAVVPFDNGGSDDFERLGVGLQSMVTTDLSQADEVTVVERSKLKGLLAEMDLATTGIVDPITAARFGRVVGATHVVAGSFTIVGDQMRLDARLTSVETGAVVGSVAAEGEKDAFFEIEKDLVKQLLGVVGAELSPKERAAINRVHTADFESFAAFSKGVALFDEDRFDEALAVLRQVAASDSDFKLANVTAEAVAVAQKRVAEKAMAARVTEAEGAFLANQESAKWEAAQFDALRAIAFDSKAQKADRVAAALVLVTLTGRVNRHGFHELRRVTDQFALRRIGDRAFQVIWTQLDPEIPRWFPRYSSGGSGLNEERGWDAAYVVERNRARFFESKHRSQTFADCKYAMADLNGVVRSLWLPTLQLLEAYADQLRRAATCEGLKPERLRSAERKVAERFRRVGEVGRAAEILERQAGTATESGELESIARDLAAVRDRAAVIEAAKSPEAAELARYASKFYAKEMESDALPHYLHFRLRRAFSVRDPFFLNGMPMWILSKGPGLGSGPRLGSDASASLRHYADTRAEFGFYRDEGNPTLVVLGGVPRRDGTLKVGLDFKPPPDWYPHASRGQGFTVLKKRPRTGVVVGLTDIETPATCDPVDDSNVTRHPLRAIAAFVDGEALVLARIEGHGDSPSCRSTRSIESVVVVEELARKPLRNPKGTLEVQVNGQQLTARLGKTSVRTTLPDDVRGFVGLYAEGEGYVELSRPGWH